MSAGFEFKKKREVVICGKAYPCDFSDSRMLEGVSRDFPRILQTADAFCREFIEGTIGPEEYREIFAGRPENSGEHMDLCAYIYSEIMTGRQEMLEQYLAPEAKEGETHEHDADANADTDTGTAGHDSGQASPDRLAVVDEKRGLRAWLASALAGKA